MRSSLTAALSLGLATLAAAQPGPLSRDLPITTINASGYSGFATPRTAVLSSQDEVRAFFSGSNVNPNLGAQVDFANEQVLVAAMGTKPTGGYSIQIRKVTLMTGGFTGGHAFVDVLERSPAPGQIVTQALTSPIHVVRVPRGAIAYHFASVAPATFDSITFSWSGGLAPWQQAHTIGADGTVVVNRTGFQTSYHSGQADPAKLQTLKDAFAAADFATLPTTIDDPVLVMDVPQLQIVATRNGADTTVTVLKSGFYGAYQSRLEPVVNIASEISEEVVARGTTTVTGQVVVQQGQLFVAGHRVYWSEPLAQLIARQAGRNVRASGRSATSSSGPRLDVETVTGRARGELFLRSQPRTTSGILTRLPAGTEVEVSRVNGSWLFVRAGTRSGWAASYYVTLSR